LAALSWFEGSAIRLTRTFRRSAPPSVRGRVYTHGLNICVWRLRHRHQEFIRFLSTVEAAVPAGKMIHAIADNYATHKHPRVNAWLARHPRWIFHFTPTSASWLNGVEGFFAKPTKRRFKRGVFRSIVKLQAAVKRFLGETNADPRPFRWTKDRDKMIAAVKGGHQVLDSIH